MPPTDYVGLIVALILVVVLLAITEIGYRVGRRQRARTDQTSKTQLNTLEAAVLALLGLLLGFSFSMAAGRFDARRLLVVDETNAIGTAWLRIGLLPEDDRDAMRTDLRRYVDARLAFYAAPSRQKSAVRATTVTLQQRLWARAAAAAARDPRAVTTGLLLQSLNQVIDLETEQMVARTTHVPTAIPGLLFMVAMLGAALVGYGCGFGNRRQFALTTILCLAIAASMFVILDLDAPRHGLIHVSTRSLRDLRASFGQEAD